MKRLLVLAIMLFGISANAGFYLDPYLSYVVNGEVKVSNQNFKEDVTGIFLGSRIGYEMLGLAFGAEYMMSKGEIDMTDGNDLSHKSLGVFVAYEFPILLRVYGTYFFSDKMDSEPSSGTTDEYEGTGMKLGVGYTGLPFVSINFEYLVSNYDENQNGSVGANDVDYNTMMIGVSVPLSL